VLANQGELLYPARPLQAFRTWLDEPLSGWRCALGWCLATSAFMGLVAVLGGFSGYDTFESVFSTWAIAHGRLECAFPHGFRVTAPLYPLLSGAVAAAVRAGHTLPFPPRDAMGPNCDRAFLVINTWSEQARVVTATVKIAFVSWFALMAGVIALIRTTRRGRTGWEPAALVLVACLPPVWTCVQSTFHPEDLLAIGLALAAVACARRGSWAAAGVLMGLAFLSQQFTILVAVPLLVVAPGPRRVPFGAGALITMAAVSIPLITASAGSAGSEGSAAHAILLGTGSTGGIGGTVLWKLGLHGLSLLVLSRLTPVAVAAAIAWWAARRLGPRALEPVALISLIALSLGLRLAFEQQLFEYYYMALSVSLLLLEVARGRFRGLLVAWMLTVPAVYIGQIQGLGAMTTPIRVAVILVALAVIVPRALRGATALSLAPWYALIAGTLIAWPRIDLLGKPPTWFLQVVLVTWGLALAAGPLVDEVRRHTAPASTTRARERLLPIPVG
jgi:hypothetical protein